MELVGLDETRCREDLEAVGGMDELDRAVRPLGRALEKERASPAAAGGPGPEVDGATVCVDVIARRGLHHESHMAEFRLRPMRDRARAVVVGGGVGGCSVLYWLARLGWDDVVLVERAELTSGSTFHSAGLVGQLRSTLALTTMMMESVDLYRSLEEEVGLETGWHEVGSLRLASSAERMEELARQAGWAKTFGLPLELISPTDAQGRFPPMTTDGVVGAALLPTDGYIDPSQLTFALAEGARRRGAEITTGTRVTGVALAGGRVAGVVTDRGVIETEVVVNAGGMYAREIGELAGVNVPIVPMAHEYLVTRPAGLPFEMPTMRDPSLLVYFRPESGGLIMGGYERHCAPWGLGGIPADFNSRLLDEDWPRFEELMENAVVRVPVARRDGGREAHQRARGVHAGRRVHPRADRGSRLLGGGRVLRPRPRRRRRHGPARRRVDRGGTPSPRRLAHGLAPLRRAHYRSREYTLARTIEIYETYYDVKYPGHERRPGGRCGCRRRTPRLARARRGLRREVGLGARQLVRAERRPGRRVAAPARLGGRLWSPAIGAEHVACRETAALFDETSFAKIEVVRRRARRRSSSGSAPTASRATSARSPTRRC